MGTGTRAAAAVGGGGGEGSRWARHRRSVAAGGADGDNADKIKAGGSDRRGRLRKRLMRAGAAVGGGGSRGRQRRGLGREWRQPLRGTGAR